MTVSPINNQLLLGGLSDQSNSFVARLNVNTKQFSWHDSAVSTVQLSAQVYIAASNRVIMVASFSNENPVILTVNADSGILLSGNRYQISGLNPIQFEQAATASGFSGAVLAGYATDISITPNRLELLYAVTNANGSITAVASLLLFGAAAPLIHAMAIEPWHVGTKAPTAYLAGVQANLYPDYGYAFIAAMTSTKPLFSPWSYCSTKTSRMYDVITVRNSAGAYEVFASGSQLLSDLMLVKIVSGKISGQITINPAANQYLDNCHLASTGQEIRIICTLSDYNYYQTLTEMVVFNIDRTSLQASKLPPGYTWHKENNFVMCNLSPIGRTTSALPIVLDQSILLTALASLTPSSLPTTLASMAPSLWVTNTTASNSTFNNTNALTVKPSAAPTGRLSNTPSFTPSSTDTMPTTLSPSSVNSLSANTYLPTLTENLNPSPTVKPTPASSSSDTLKSIVPTVAQSHKQASAQPSYDNVTSNSTSLATSSTDTNGVFIGLVVLGSFVMLAIGAYSLHHHQVKLKKIHADVRKNSQLTDIESNTPLEESLAENSLHPHSTAAIISIKNLSETVLSEKHSVEDMDFASISDMSDGELSILANSLNGSKISAVKGLNEHRAEETRHTSFSY